MGKINATTSATLGHRNIAMGKIKAATAAFAAFDAAAHAAATLVQSSFRRMAAIKRVARMKRMRKKHEKLREIHGTDWTAEDSAANLVQNSFRRMSAMKRLARKRRLQRHHQRLAELNGSAWSNSDSMACLLQATFRAKLAKRAVDKATKFVVRARMEFWHSDIVIGTLRKPPRDRTDEDLELVHSSFVNIQFVHDMESKLVQLQCCRYLQTRTIQCGATVFKQGDVGDLLYIVLSGCVEYQVDQGKAVLHSGIGDYFGEQSLQGENGGRRDATVTAKEDTVVATLERGDYLRLSNELTGEVLQVLKKSGPRRKPVMLRLVQNLFQDTPFFRKIHFSVLQRYCCGLMQLGTLQPGRRLFQQGDHGEEFYIIIEGQVDVFITDDGATEPKFIRTLDAGDSFGELALISDDPDERIRTATIEANSENTTPVLLAKLSRDAYIDATKRLEKKVFKILDKDTEDRTDKQIETLFEFFQEEDFFLNLKLDGMRRQCCAAMILQRVGAGEIVFAEGDIGETFHVMIRGETRVIVNGQTVRTLGPGASFGEIALLGETEEDRRRTATIMANDDTLMASMTKMDFMRVQDQKELQSWINKFWVLLTTTITEVGITAEVEWEAYRQLHVRIRKTIAPEFSRKESRAAAKEDWQEDLNRHNKGGQTMNHEQFSNALFELVDVWCEGAPSMLMYIEFLRMVFLNVTILGRKKGHLQPKHVVKKVEDVSCLANQLDNMRESLTERFNVEEERAERDRQVLVQHANIGMVSSEMYAESSSGKLWVNAKALVKSSIKAGIFKDDLELEDHSGSSSSSSSSSSDDEEFSSPHSLTRGQSGRGQSGSSMFGSTEAERRARMGDSPHSGGGSRFDDGFELGARGAGAGSSGPTPEQRREQLANKMDEIQERLAGGVFTSSEELESAIVELQMMGGSDLRWTGMEEEHMQMLEELETQFAMKYAAETGTCYIPPDPASRRRNRRRKGRAGVGRDHWGSMDGHGHGRGGGTGDAARRRSAGMQTWRDQNWAPSQIWAQSLLSQQPVGISAAAITAPPSDPRRVIRNPNASQSRRSSRQTSTFRRSTRTSVLPATPSRTGRRLHTNERRRSVEAARRYMRPDDPSVLVRQSALDSKRWFQLEIKPEGSRRVSTQPVAAPRLDDVLRRPNTSLGISSFDGRSSTDYLDRVRPMSSYSTACLQVSRGGAHPMLYEEPWHRPSSAKQHHGELSMEAAAAIGGGRNDPLGVEPVVFTAPMDHWFGKRAMLSPGRRGRPRTVPA